MQDRQSGQKNKEIQDLKGGYNLMNICQTLYSDKRGYIFFSSTHSIVTKANPIVHYKKHIP